MFIREFWVKVVIAGLLLTSLCAYHSLLMSSIESFLEKTKEQVSQQMKIIERKTEMMKNSVPYDMLDDIEFRHGHNNKKVNCL